MASSTLALPNLADASITYTLVGQSNSGALYRDATRSLALPRTLEFKYNIGIPGAKGNDKVTVILRDTVQNGTTGLVSTSSASLTMSIARDDSWTETFSNDVLCQVAGLLSDANIAKLVDGLTP